MRYIVVGSDVRMKCDNPCRKQPADLEAAMCAQRMLLCCPSQHIVDTQ